MTTVRHCIGGPHWQPAKSGRRTRSNPRSDLGETPGAQAASWIRGTSTVSHRRKVKRKVALLPQRSSLRCAVRASLESSRRMVSHQSDSAQSVLRVLVQKSGARTQNVRNKTKSSATKVPSINLRDFEGPGLASQRNSLRRAIRESLEMVANYPKPKCAPTPTLNHSCSSRYMILKHVLETFTPNSDDGVVNGASLSNADSRATHISPLLFNITAPVSCTDTASMPLAVVSHPAALPQDPASSIFSAPSLQRNLRSHNHVIINQSPALTSQDKSINGNGKLQISSSDTPSASTRNGWYEVRGIIYEAPGGLYLVEWKGRDPRTGVMWPASWVKAKNVSASAVLDWEGRKHRLPSSSGKLP
ncbi:hypothetical protein GGS21DRAFT_386457 [Xylaria nigripes]|nr:hypothetical protein GGS21DRAFT_386457 [Xylaria nigripes]